MQELENSLPTRFRVTSGEVPPPWTPEERFHLVKYLATENFKAVEQGRFISINSIFTRLDNSAEGWRPPHWTIKRSGGADRRYYTQFKEQLDVDIYNYSTKFFNTNWNPDYSDCDIDRSLLPLRGLWRGSIHPSLIDLHCSLVQSSSSLDDIHRCHVAWSPVDQYRFVKYLSSENHKAITEGKFISIRDVCLRLEESPDIWTRKRPGSGWFSQYMVRRVYFDEQIRKFSAKYFKSKWHPDYTKPENDERLLPLRGLYQGHIHPSFCKVKKKKIRRVTVAAETHGSLSSELPKRSLALVFPMDRTRRVIHDPGSPRPSNEHLPQNKNVFVENFQHPQPARTCEILTDVSDYLITSSFSNADVGLICKEGIKSFHPTLSVLQSGFNAIIREMSVESGFGPRFVKDLWFLVGDLEMAKSFLARRKPCDVTS